MTLLHTGCMNEGERYSVKAKFKLVDNDGDGIVCNNEKSTSDKCPKLGLKSYTDGGIGKVTKIVAKSVGTQATGAWNEIYGEFNVSPKDANGDYHQLYITNSHDYTYIVDDFEVQKRVDDSCSELIFNGNLDIGFAGVYDTYSGSKSKIMNVLVNGNPAVQVSNRKKNNHGIRYIGSLDYQCVSPGCMFEVSANLKMVGNNGADAPCDITQVKSNNSACPAIYIELRDTSNKKFLKKDLRGYAVQWNSDTFNKFVATFTVPQMDENITIKSVVVAVRGFKSDHTLIMDNLSVKRLHCDGNMYM